RLHVARRKRGDAIGETRRLLGDELRGMREGETLRLLRHHLGHLGDAVAYRADDGAAAAVEVLATGVVVDPDSFGAHGDGIRRLEIPGEEAGRSGRGPFGGRVAAGRRGGGAGLGRSLDDPRRGARARPGAGLTLAQERLVLLVAAQPGIVLLLRLAEVHADLLRLLERFLGQEGGLLDQRSLEGRGRPG